MLKAQLILIAVRIVMGLVALGLGIWYVSSSIGGAAITYTSMDNFLVAAGVENGDIATANGCFLCRYIADLFGVLGSATEKFWTLMVDNLWILMVIGFGIFIFIHTVQYIFNHAKQTATLEPKEHKIEFHPWFEKIWKQGIRIIFVGVLMGALGMGGTDALKTVSQITITPVLYVGAELSMAATGVTDAAQCNALASGHNTESSDILNPVMNPFMCVMGNINSVMLAGAAGGFAMMNYAWMGMGGGAFTWIAGLVLVIMFMIIGFDLFFQILSVVFKLIFLIIFMPLLLAASAFEGTWAKASGLVSKALEMLISSAVRIVAITLKVLVIYATVSYTADTFMPGPNDGYSAILPPMMGQVPENPDAQTLSVMNVFKTCEQVALANGEMDKDAFKNCFTARRAEVERKYPGAFDFMKDGWNFLLMMVCLFCLYYYAISPKIDKLLPAGGVKLPIPGENANVATGEQFDFGAWIHDLGQKIWHVPVQITEKISKAMGKK
ncbi:MAG: hypothetical protein E7011_03160 [Alphaproteobacteria bacterium]|nr:hypothetical protein [Alphaproteobacteria bacterium]